jgi:amino acid permease
MFSFAVFALFVAIHYAFVNNPKFENLKTHAEFYSTFQFTGMIVFSMSCAGIVIPVENNMREPTKFPVAFAIGKCIL